jgi:CO/xanthine dehydrogenase FAD-binding subunit
MRAFAYARPDDQTEALQLLASNSTGARPLAGGTDLMVGLRGGRVTPPLVVDIKGVRELGPWVDETASHVTIAATTTLTDVMAEQCVRRYFPALVEAAATVGSVQIRNRATLAGNICNASPAADTAPALLVYGAEVALVSSRGARLVLLDDFFLGPGLTLLEPGELLAAIRLPKPGPSFGAAFGRLTRRRGVDLATIIVCCGIDGSGATRWSYGAVGPRPLLVTGPSGVPPAPAEAEYAEKQSIEAAMARTSPISDVRASREYRYAMLPVLSRRVLAVARERSSGR